MGWQGNEMEIPVGMIFKKMYCHECGNRLKVKKISNVYKKGDDNYTDSLLGNFTIGMSSVKKHIMYTIVQPAVWILLTMNNVISLREKGIQHVMKSNFALHFLEDKL